ncbi:hypothetical protein [Chitinophaga sp. Cy-1792]|uniref:hypothetical protein n=1 Tax=Chitinophaga sp. Cy-1792 TaxID=2608339 RepID=UPI001423EB5F|nr:hypothetical protein [Chitinophaga sp. Cy-1792]NIG57267.1 hypothetical protein [Chitinophaga sp. Cy-1792]
MSTNYYHMRGYKGFWPWINIPQSRHDEKYADQATALFAEFLRNIPCKKKTMLGFRIFIEPVIDYAKQADSRSDSGWTLDCHVKYEVYANAKPSEKLSLVMTACQLMLKAKANEPGYTKRGTDYAGIAHELEEFLQDRGLYYSDTSFFFKPTTNTRFTIISITGPHAERKQLKFDLHQLQSYLTNKLADKQFGTGLRDIDCWFGIFKYDGEATSYFNGDKDLGYSAKKHSVRITRNVDYNVIIKLDKDQLYKYYKEIIEENLQMIVDSNKVPRKFDFPALHEEISHHLDVYTP